jgi:hemerythrin-like domain-containing protein
VDAIGLIKEDHRTVEALFKRFEKAGSRAYKTKRTIADRVIKELSIHAAIEEQLLYPVMRQHLPKGEELVQEAVVEHSEAKKALAAMKPLRGDDPLLDAKMAELIGGVRHHVKEEEREMLPQLRKAMSRTDLQELGNQLKQAKRTTKAA